MKQKPTISNDDIQKAKQILQQNNLPTSGYLAIVQQCNYTQDATYDILDFFTNKTAQLVYIFFVYISPFFLSIVLLLTSKNGKIYPKKSINYLTILLAKKSSKWQTTHIQARLRSFFSNQSSGRHYARLSSR